MDDNLLRQRRESLELLARAGIDAVRTEAAIRSVVRSSDPFWQGCTESGFAVLSFGKASHEMASAVIDHLGSPVKGLVVTHRPTVGPLPNCDVITASHPVPDRQSLLAGTAVDSLIESIAPDLAVVILISGGASSLVEVPRPGVSLADLQLVNEQLLRSGTPISSMNVVRQALSSFKGGGLASRLRDRETRTLVISDVVGNDPRTIASGPMSPPIWEIGDPWERSPASLRTAVSSNLADLLRTAQPIVTPEQPISVIADASLAAAAAHAAAEAIGLEAQVLTSTMEGDATETARWMLQRSRPGVFISAGETTVVVGGTGLGGRNQHAALTWATEVDDPGTAFAAIAVGTDGRDGPTDAAGALVDSSTATRIRSAGGDPFALLANDDSHRALGMAGDLIPAEPTGTNVGDLWIVHR